MNNTSNNQILKILIGMGIITVVVSVYIQYIIPFQNEQKVQKIDQKRIANLTDINTVLNKIKEINPNLSLGEPNKIYISIPSFRENCDSLSLPPLPHNWAYRCKTETDYKKIDGQGWIPVDFTKLPKDFNINTSLATDPNSIYSSDYYYTYSIDEKNNWVCTTTLGSKKYLKENAQKDHGTDPTRFEIGPSTLLWTRATGLAGYWSFDEGLGKTAKDLSENNNNGTLFNSPSWVNGKVGKGLNFDGNDDYVEIPHSKSLDIVGSITITAWVKPKINRTFSIISKNTFQNDYEFTYRNDFNMLELNYRTPKLETPLSTNFPLDVNAWAFFAVSLNCDTKQAQFYLNGQSKKGQLVNECPNNYYSNPLTIGSRTDSGIPLKGLIDEIRIYNRALRIDEIQSLYNATK